ncbi:MAG TPA: hypothetical protein VIS96_17700 [Terrimicrobiaceae bacterium]
MNAESESTSSGKWRFQALARSLSLELQKRHGRNQHYLPDHVIEACDACGVAEADRQYAIAMFATPSESDGILQKMRSSKTSTETRKFLAGQMMFGSSGEGYDYDRYDFHDAGISDIAASGGSGGFDGADGGGDGGGGGD